MLYVASYEIYDLYAVATPISPDLLLSVTRASSMV